MAVTALVRRERIIDRVAAGDYLADIASSCDVSAPAISKILHDDPEYIAAKEIGIAQRLENALQGIDSIDKLGVNSDGEIIGLDNTLVNLARVREIKLRATQWHAEREFGHIYRRDSVNIQVNQQVNVNAAPEDRFDSARKVAFAMRVAEQAKTVADTPILQRTNDDNGTSD